MADGTTTALDAATHGLPHNIEAEQALLVVFAPGSRAGPQVEEQRARDRPGLEDVDHARLVEDEPPAGAVARVGHDQDPSRRARLQRVDGRDDPRFEGEGMTSTRLPGKVLLPAGDSTMLGHHLTRLSRTGLPIIVATTISRHVAIFINFFHFYTPLHVLMKFHFN